MLKPTIITIIVIALIACMFIPVPMSTQEEYSGQQEKEITNLEIDEGNCVLVPYEYVLEDDHTRIEYNEGQDKTYAFIDIELQNSEDRKGSFTYYATCSVGDKNWLTDKKIRSIAKYSKEIGQLKCTHEGNVSIEIELKIEAPNKRICDAVGTEEFKETTELMYENVTKTRAVTINVPLYRLAANKGLETLVKLREVRRQYQ